jgi:hypothetical protein
MRRSRVPASVWFAAWFLVGAGFALALLGAMTIGIFVLPVVLGVTALVATRRGSTVGVGGLVAGPALLLFFVAYLNRDGPGTICRSIESGTECVEEWSPWPWLAVGVLMLAVGLGVFVTMRRNHRRADRGSVGAAR